MVVISWRFGSAFAGAPVVGHKIMLSNQENHNYRRCPDTDVVQKAHRSIELPISGLPWQVSTSCVAEKICLARREIEAGVTLDQCRMR